MANTTKIEWCDMTINPIVGCSKCSPGCDNCYAEKLAARLVTMHFVDLKYATVVTDGKWNGKIASHYGCFEKLPGSGSRPQRIFVNSMGDVFHEQVDMTEAMVLFQYMQIFPHHTFLVLTKRAERMRREIQFEQSLREREGEREAENGIFRIWPLPNVWLGVTVCNAGEKAKIDDLRATPAAKRFISFEPLLGDVGELDLAGIDWVIVGGESGPKARPMHPDWARSIRDQCQSAKVPFFFKQWGEWGTTTHDMTTGDPVFRIFPDHQKWTQKASTWINGGICLDYSGKVLENGGDFAGAAYPIAVLHRIGKKAAGCILDGREWKESPA